MIGGGKVMTEADPGLTRDMAVTFLTYLLIFRSLIEVRSQNQDVPTAYTTRHDISQNQRPGL